MAKSYFLKRREHTYSTQKDFKERLDSIRKMGLNNNGYIKDPEAIDDLRDYLEDYHPDANELKAQFNISECEFFVDKAEDYSTYCLYIKKGTTKKSFSINKFSAPTLKALFSQRCAFILQDKKLEIKKLKMSEKQIFDSPENYALHHESPKFSDIIKRFITENNLADKLEDIVSPNGSNNNAPILKNDYEYLDRKFLSFYEEIYPDLTYKLIEKR